MASPDVGVRIDHGQWVLRCLGRELVLSGLEDPSPTVIEPEVHEPPEVDGGHSHRQAELVAGHAPVPNPSPPVGHEPGDRSFHHGPMSTVRNGELLGLAVAPRRCQQVVVGVEVDGSAIPRCRAA